MAEAGDASSSRRFGPFTPLVERVFGRPGQKVPSTSEKDALTLPELDEGKVPYVELFRIIREHQYDLASGLYSAYKDQFPKGFLAHTDYQDYGNGI